jgi:hypothetical protein
MWDSNKAGRSAMTSIVTGLFGRRREADLVVEHLVQEFAIPREQVQVHAADAEGNDARSAQDDTQEAPLSELGLPEAALRAYQEGSRKGGILVVAWVDDEHLDRALAAYREYGAEEPRAQQVASPAHEGADVERQIQLRAYFLWEEEGRPEGRDLEFWHRARQIEGSGHT